MKKVKKDFRETDITDKTKELEKTENKFGYKSLHLGLSLKTKGKKLSENSKYFNLQFELQIRTIIQDAWSILDHKIKYKKSIPNKLKRRINRLSALFEIADDEFLSIHKEINQEEKRIDNRIKKGAFIEKNKGLDVFRFLFIALKHFPNYNFVEFKVDGFVHEILNLKSNLTESELNDIITKYLPYTENIASKEKRGLNPYTKTRYCLYLYDKVIFDNILSTYQKETISNSEIK